MSRQDKFEWKGVSFTWDWHRMAFVGCVELSGKNHTLFTRPSTAGAEAWVEFQGGYTMSCVMSNREQALDGAVIALRSFYESVLEDLKPFESGVVAP